MTAAAPSVNAQRTAVGRAIHQLLDHPRVFDDPLAVAIAGGEISVTPGSLSLEMRYSRALMAARSRHAEDALNAAMAGGAAQYVILGAGLDTYAYRNRNINLRVFEVDHPATQTWKRTRLDAAGIAIPPSLAFVPSDFEERTLPSALAGAGFQAREVSFFSWLGFSPYPSAQATLATLAFIGSLPAGSGVAFDYAVRRSLFDPALDSAPVPTLDAGEETAMDALASRLAAQGEPLRLFVDSRALHKLLRSAGFHEVEDLGPPEIDKRYFSNRADGLRVPPGLAHLVTARV
jgi:methyltransferase (TIGR00027 family)